MPHPFPIPPSYAPKTVQVVDENDAGFSPGTILEVRHARASLLCVVDPATLKDCYILRGNVRSLDRA